MTDWLKKISPCLRIVGHGWHEPGWIEPLRVIYDHELVIVSDGRVTMEIDNKVIDCPPNSFIIIPPGLAHVSSDSFARRTHRHWVHFDWVYQPTADQMPVLSYHPAKPKTKLYHLAPDFVPKQLYFGSIRSPSYVMDMHERLCEQWNHGQQHDRLICRAILMELLLELLDRQRRDDNELSNNSPLASKARLQLEKIAQKPVNDSPSIQNTLEELGYSYAHLCRLFRQAYGLAPLGYVNAIRIERAKLLLRDTELTISQVACRVGFDNPAYFSRLFKKQTTMSPREFITRKGK